MPGRNPKVAVDEYKSELEKVFGCLEGFCQINFLKGDWSINSTCTWTLTGNDDEGMRLQGDSRMTLTGVQTLRFVLVDDSRPTGECRLETVSYEYKLLDSATRAEHWVMHWLPETPHGRKYPFPHLHMPPREPKRHLMTPRMLAEHAVHWAIEYGAKPHGDGWAETLAKTREKHVADRSWADDPDHG